VTAEQIEEYVIRRNGITLHTSNELFFFKAMKH